MGDAPDILDLLRKAATDERARWDFAQSEKIQSILDRELRKHAIRESDLEDLRGEALVEIVQTFASGGAALRFEDEGRAVAYWNRRIRSLVEAGLRRSGSNRYREGRIVRREHAIAFADEMAAASLGPDEDVARMREIVEAYPDRRAAECFESRSEGAQLGAFAQRLGYDSLERARTACHRVFATAVDAFVESAEPVVVTNLGLHVEAGEVAAVVYRRGEVLESWSFPYLGPESLRDLDRRLRAAMNRKVSQAAANDGPACEESIWVSHVCLDRGIPLERFDLDAVLAGLPEESVARVGVDLPRGERLALLVAIAKAAENRLKVERY